MTPTTQIVLGILLTLSALVVAVLALSIAGEPKRNGVKPAAVYGIAVVQGIVGLIMIPTGVVLLNQENDRPPVDRKVACAQAGGEYGVIQYYYKGHGVYEPVYGCKPT